MTWTKSPVDAAAVREMSRRYEIDLLTATILARRGITDPASLRFVLEDDVGLLHNPFLMPAMADAVDRINQAIDEGEKILVFGDRDVDGITSTVLLLEAIRELGGEVQWALPEGEDGYGLSPAVVESAAAAGVGLLVTVDCGISNAVEVALASGRGIDTVVVDHHNPPAVLPEAAALVNPKLDGYPFRDLCACAVAWKVEWALRFSRSPFYGEPVTLLNARPANETIVVEAARLVNLAVTARVTESVVPGLVPFEKTRLAGFVRGEDLLVLDAPGQARLLARAFGGELPLSLTDMGPLLADHLPDRAGRSLLRIQQDTKAERWAPKAAEIDALADTFAALVRAREKDRLAPAIARLDLVALGTLADLMPLANENRAIVRRGLQLLRATERDGMRQLLRRLDLLGRKFGATEVAWQISPVLNSAGRMGEPSAAVRLLVAGPAEAEAAAAELAALNTKRRSLGETSWSLALDQARSSLDRTEGRCVLVHDERIPRGITGILASRLQGFFKAPAVVIASAGPTAIGSIRANRGGMISGFFERHAPSFSSWGGHDFAGGFSLEKSRLAAFVESFFETSSEIAAPEGAEETLAVDAEVPVAHLTPDVQRIVELLEPFGEGNPPLLFLTRGMRVAHAELIGKREAVHLKLLLEAGATRWPAVWWNAASRFPGEFSIGDTVDVVYRMGRNTWGGGETLQLTVQDLRR